MSNDANTQPTIETVLQRINALGERFEKRFDEAIGQLKSLSRKLDVINKELLEMKGEQQELRDRIEVLERKPS